MKKLVLSTVCALGVAGVALGQGTIAWQPASTSLVFQTNAVSYSPLFGGGSASGVATGTSGNVASWATQPFYYTLLTSTYTGSQAAAPTSLAALGSWSTAWADSSVYATNATLANGRPVMNPANDTGQTVTWANGTTQNVMVVGWSANLGTSWAQVTATLNSWNGTIDNAYLGFSSTGFINPGQVNPGVTIFGTPTGVSYGTLIYSPSASAGQLYLLPTVIVPEPTTLALAGLGGLSLLLFRRRQQK
jgi:hypothetical protein